LIKITYENLIEPHKKIKNYVGLSSCYLNLGSVYAFLNEKDKSLQAIDSAIAYSKIIGNKDFNLYKIYYDSVNDLEEAKRFTELDLNYKFDKEKEIAAVELKSEKSKKTVYFILLFITVLVAFILIYLLRKNNKQRMQLAENALELKEVEKLKADLVLANREKELKKLVIENSITDEVLNKTLDDIKEIITFENEHERQIALKSLSASLLSEKIAKSSTTSS